MNPAISMTGATFGIIPIRPVRRLEKARINMTAITMKENRKDLISPLTIRTDISANSIISPRIQHWASGKSSASF